MAESDADPATEIQRQAARQLIESGQPLFLPKNRGPGTGVGARRVRPASCRTCQTIASFDASGFARRIHQLNLPPGVVVPS